LTDWLPVSFWKVNHQLFTCLTIMLLNHDIIEHKVVYSQSYSC